MAGPMPGLLSLVEELYGRMNKERLFGGGVRGAATRGLLGADAPENATPAEMEAYRNIANASMALAAGPVAATRAMRGAKTAQAITQDKFLELASKGRLNMAKSSQQEVDDLLKGKSKFAELRLNWEDPSTYDFIEGLEKKGFKSQVNTNRPDAPTYIFKNKGDIEAVLSAKTPYDFGKAYGYSDADIANFYLNRRRGVADLAFEDWIRDNMGR